MTLKYLFLIFVFIIGSGRLFGQGQVTFHESPTVATAFAKYVAKNRAETTIKGWRIQIVSTDDRREMEAIRARFTNLFPGVPSSWKHISPYYQIRVGAYRTKAEMTTFLAMVKKEFPASIPVQDDIQKYDLISY